jgi:hypothetical protein
MHAIANFSACPVWTYIQSNITKKHSSPEYNTTTTTTL